MSGPGFSPGGTSPLPWLGSPPPFNGGVIGLARADAHGLGGPPRFDKYEATVYRPNDEVLQTLKERWAPNTVWEDKPHTVSNYAYLRQGTRWEPELAIKWGGQQPNPWVQSNAGVVSPALAKIVREWPHKVTTVDVKFDIQGEGAFEYAWAVVNRIRTAQRIVPKAKGHGDIDGIDGRTVYVGSNQSPFRLTIYEKSKQLRAVKGLIVPDNIVRIEGRFRPQTKEQGIAMAKLDPVQFWATVKYGREIFEELVKEAIEPVQLPRNQPPADDVAMVNMLAMYLKAVRRVKEREGGWENFGAYLGHLEDEAEEVVRERQTKIRTRNEAAKHS